MKTRGLPDTSPGGPIGSAGEQQELLRLMLLARSIQWSGEAGRRRAQPHRASPLADTIAAAVGLSMQPGDQLLAPLRYLSAHLEGGLEVADHLRGAVPPFAGAPGELLVELAAGVALGLAGSRRDAVAFAIVPENALADADLASAWGAVAAKGWPLVLVLERRRESPEPPMPATAIAAGEAAPVLGACRDAAARARAGAGPIALDCRAPATGGPDPFERLVARVSSMPGGRQQVVRLREQVGQELRAAAERAAAGARAPAPEPVGVG